MSSVILASSRRFRRWCTVWGALGLSATVICLWAAVVAHSLATVMAVSTATCLAIYPTTLARGRLAVTDEGFQARWPRSVAGPPASWSSVTGLELRRGLLLEKVQVITDRPRVLCAPARFRFQTDPDFDAAVAELARHSGHPVRPSRPRLFGIAAFGVAWVASLGLLTAMNAPWNDPAWPWRHEADRLPDPCAGFAATAGTLLPAGERTPDADVLLLGPVDRQQGCTWREGPIDTFSVGLGLTHKGLFTSASATAHGCFGRTVGGARHPGGTATPVPGLADEARTVTDGIGGDPAAVDLIARRANVIVTVRLVTARPDPAARRTAEQVARTALAEVRLG